MALGLDLMCPRCGARLEDYSHKNSDGLFICRQCKNEFSLLSARKGQGENYRPFGADVSKEFGGEIGVIGSKKDFSYDLFQAEMLTKDGKFKDAKIIYDRIIREEPKNFDAWLGKSQLDIVQQNIVNFYGNDINISGLEKAGKTKAMKELKKLGFKSDEAKFVYTLIENNNIHTKINSEYAEYAIQIAQSPAEKKRAMERYMQLETRLSELKKESKISDKTNRKSIFSFLLIFLFLGGITLLILKILGVF